MLSKSEPDLFIFLFVSREGRSSCTKMGECEMWGTSDHHITLAPNKEHVKFQLQSLNLTYVVIFWHSKALLSTLQKDNNITLSSLSKWGRQLGKRIKGKFHGIMPCFGPYAILVTVAIACI